MSRMDAGGESGGGPTAGPDLTRHQLLKSAWSWDLWGAAPVGAACGAGWLMLVSDSLPRWWLLCAFVMSISSVLFAEMSWRRYDKLADGLDHTDYGQLIGMVDSDRSNLRAPYAVARGVSFISAGCTMLAAAALPLLPTAWTAAAAGLAAFCWAWSLFAAIAIWRLSAVHDGHISRLKAMRDHSDDSAWGDAVDARRRGLGESQR